MRRTATRGTFSALSNLRNENMKTTSTLFGKHLGLTSLATAVTHAAFNEAGRGGVMTVGQKTFAMAPAGAERGANVVGSGEDAQIDGGHADTDIANGAGTVETDESVHTRV